MTNPLLDFTDLPLFDRIEAAHIAPAMSALLQEADAALARVSEPDFPAEWAAMSATLDVATERLSRAWSAVNHLNAVADTPELRAAYNEALPQVTDFWTRLGSCEALYAKYKAMDERHLTPEQQRARKLALQGFVLGGAELQGEAKARFAAIQERLATLSQSFGEHVLDATDQWSLAVPAERLAGVPHDVVQAARSRAEQAGPQSQTALQGQGDCLLTLQLPCYLPVMQFAHDRDLRQTLYRAHVTRASDTAQGSDAVARDNTPLMQEIVQLRQEEAQLLGHRNYAEVSLVPKMADSPEKVMGFLRDLAQRARPHAERDVQELQAFARERGCSDLQAWDLPYYSEQLKEARYAYSEQEVKPYFTAPRVLAGLFEIIETQFDVRIQVDQAPVWNPAVQFFRIERNGHLVGQFYLDTPARKGKRGGAWMDDVRARWLRPDTQALQTPVAHLICNFADGVDGQPALLTHDDVITLFHEAGHGLHHLLTQVNERDVSGISGVEWDAVELPSQFMENFCWEWSVLQKLTAHVETGEPLPRALFDKMRAAKNFQSGLQTLRQIEFALFDMRLHAEPEQAPHIQRLLEDVRAEVAVITPPAFNRMAHSFSHIFAGGYAAGYYSYKWAEVLSADAWAAFEESPLPDGSPNPATGQRYRKAILEVGGSRPAMESFRAFRGREPEIDALLRHNGMGAVGQAAATV